MRSALFARVAKDDRESRCSIFWLRGGWFSAQKPRSLSDPLDVAEQAAART
jgi:hypothetical protein